MVKIKALRKRHERSRYWSFQANLNSVTRLNDLFNTSSKYKSNLKQIAYLRTGINDGLINGVIHTRYAITSSQVKFYFRTDISDLITFIESEFKHIIKSQFREFTQQSNITHYINNLTTSTITDITYNKNQTDKEEKKEEEEEEQELLLSLSQPQPQTQLTEREQLLKAIEEDPIMKALAVTSFIK